MLSASTSYKTYKLEGGSHSLICLFAKWGSSSEGQRITIMCDNSAIVDAINSSIQGDTCYDFSSSPLLSTYLRVGCLRMIIGPSPSPDSISNGWIISFSTRCSLSTLANLGLECSNYAKGCRLTLERTRSKVRLDRYKPFPVTFEALTRWISDAVETTETETVQSYLTVLRSHHVNLDSPPSSSGDERIK
jgi:hypothetical protein